MFKDSEETSLAKPGKTSVANQAWTRRATRRQQITDLINDAQARARLILAPKNLGTKVGCWLEIRCLPFGKDRYTWTVSHFSIQMSNTHAGLLMEIKPFVQSIWCKQRSSLVPKSWSPYDFEMGRFYLCISGLFGVNACNSPRQGFLRARHSTLLFSGKST